MLKTANIIQIDTLSTTLLLDCSDNNVKTVYYGAKLADITGCEIFHKRSRTDAHASVDNLDTYLRPFSFFGDGNDKEPYVLIQSKKCGFVSKFSLRSAEISRVKPHGVLPLAHTFNEVLTLDYYDNLNGVELSIFITTYDDSDVITFSSRVKNLTDNPIKICRLFSAQVDIDCVEAEVITLDGAWASERQIGKQTLTSGTLVVDSKIGSSSNKHNPFVAVTPKNCGYSIGFNPIYSGNHKTLCEMSPLGQARIMSGMNDFCLSYPLLKDEILNSPEVAVVLQSDIGAITNQMHGFVNNHIIPRQFRDRPRPVLLNNWEATYFNFNPAKLVDLADKGSELGIELFVLDDGWFGSRNGDNTALGDWFDNSIKTGGLDKLSNKVNSLGMEFGIWVEPEMISRHSELYKSHPEYVMQLDSQPIERRNQLMLDLCNHDVRQYIIDRLTKIIELAQPTYIKWDCNRVMSDAFSRCVGDMGKYFYDYIAGLYNILETITTKYPNILFEGCSAGGNRYDLGILCYMPQIWASDNTDARSRVDIQLGTLMAYPQSTMGAHVSAVPNHQTNNITPLLERFVVACSGLLGYELDIAKLTDDEREQIKQQVQFYKTHRQLLQFGEYELVQNDNYVVQTFKSRDSAEMIATCVRKVNPVNRIAQKFRLKGLDSSKIYEMSVFGGEQTQTISGAVLNSNGLDLCQYFKGNPYNAISAFIIYIKQIDN